MHFCVDDSVGVFPANQVRSYAHRANTLIMLFLLCAWVVGKHSAMSEHCDSCGGKMNTWKAITTCQLYTTMQVGTHFVAVSRSIIKTREG